MGFTRLRQRPRALLGQRVAPHGAYEATRSPMRMIETRTRWFETTNTSLALGRVFVIIAENGYSRVVPTTWLAVIELERGAVRASLSASAERVRRTPWWRSGEPLPS